jgi:hypothetical protein
MGHRQGVTREGLVSVLNDHLIRLNFIESGCSDWRHGLGAAN